MRVHTISTSSFFRTAVKPTALENPLPEPPATYFQRAFSVNPNATPSDIAKAIISIRDLESHEIANSLIPEATSIDTQREMNQISNLRSLYEETSERQSQYKSLELFARFIDKLIDNKISFISNGDLNKHLDTTIDNFYSHLRASIIDYNSDTLSLENLVESIKKEIDSHRNELINESGEESKKEYFAWLLGTLGRFTYGFHGGDNGFESDVPNAIIESLSFSSELTDYNLIAEIERIARRQVVTPYNQSSSSPENTGD